MEQEHFELLFPDDARFAEIEQITSFVREGSSCQLFGIPGAGRSTLLGLLARNKNIRAKHLKEAALTTHFVLANFSEIRKRPLFDAMKFLFLNLADSLRQRKMTKEYEAINGLFREDLKLNDELVLFQGLKQAIDYLALEKKLTIVFLFDRFEEYIPTVTSDFFANLRVLRNRAKYQFSIVFSVSRPLETLLEPSLLADFYEFVAGHHVYLHLYDEPSTTFRVSYTEKVTKKKLPRTALPEILKLTGGHGMLTKLAVEALLVHPSPKDLASFLLTQWTITGTLRKIWLWLLPSEQADLLEGNFADREAMHFLEDVGLIKNNATQIPLFSQFLASEPALAKPTETNIAYDENTNTIKKGEVVLS